MIKRIQLRGISHEPSGRMTQDGGLEDCIGLRMEDQEHAPAVAPENVTDKLAPGLSASGIDVMYIHKTNSYANYIGRTSAGLDAYVKYPDREAWHKVHVMDLPADAIVSVANLGNIIVVTFESSDTRYAIYKDGEYRYLGAGFPVPQVQFFTEREEIKYRSYIESFDDALNVKNFFSDINNFEKTSKFWNFIKEKSSDVDKADIGQFYSNIVTNIWAYVDSVKRESLGDEIFCAPVLVRYAIRLYDGSYIGISAPILLAACRDPEDSSFPLTKKNGDVHMFVDNILARLLYSKLSYTEEDKPNGLQYAVKLAQRYSAKVSISIDDVGDWRDLVDSIDIFLSPDILLPGEGTALSYSGFSSEAIEGHFPATSIDLFTGHGKSYASINFKGFECVGYFGDEVGEENDFSMRYSLDSTFEQEYLTRSNFYLVASYPLDKLPKGERIKPVAQDDLVVKIRLEESSESGFVLPAGNLFAYNNRIGCDSYRKVVASESDNAMALIDGIEGTPKSHSLFYHIRDKDGNSLLIKGYSNKEFVPDAHRAYVAYPDPGCYQADLYVESVAGYNKYILPMKEHPRLGVSYGFFGLGSRLGSTGNGRTLETVDSLPDASDISSFYDVSRTLALSEMDNPFVFPLGQRVKFSSRIVKVMPVTTALSAGQFGQFPLYVFTEEGIWTVSLNDEGGLAAAHPLSRDVALDGTVAQLDQAVVFVSSQGVMILSGAQAVCVSPFMRGPKWSAAEFVQSGGRLRQALDADGFGPLVGEHLNLPDFQEFVSGCRPCYDYGNRRILFFKSGAAFDYSLDTQTWHRVMTPGSFTRVLNGYPDALAVFSGGIYDWSVRADYGGAGAPAKSLLLTRPFDLGEPDVRKSIRQIRIRGHCNHGDMKYLLFGSFDGIRWQRITSLHGSSYKTFRILLLANLSPGERISWIDVDYESRFTDKLR